MKRILICNTGMSATKFCISLKDAGYWIIGIATPNDIESNYKYLHMVDQKIYVPDNNVYMDSDALVSLAQRVNADAVFPGWGYLSEDAGFAKKVQDFNIIFLGPESNTIDMVGDKIEFLKLCNKLNINSLPWVAIQDKDELQENAEKIGYPVMLKAASLGGGRGICLVSSEMDLCISWEQIQRQAPGDDIFMTKFLARARHIEVQLLGDGQGICIHLGTRDCSIQRKNQKLIEEAPAQKLGDLCEVLCDAGVCIGTNVQLRGLATIEFLVQDNCYYILECNPRLQVEHVVTERVYGLNLPKLLVDVCFRRVSLKEFHFNKVENHCLAARITAEGEDFIPTCGDVSGIHLTLFNNSQWAYFSIDYSGKITSKGDSQFGHVFCTGKDRDEAIQNMVQVLSNLKIYGNISNTGAKLRRVFESESFQNIDYHTRWLESATMNRLQGCVQNDGITENVNTNPKAILDANILLEFDMVLFAGIYFSHIRFNENLEKVKKLVEKGHPVSTNTIPQHFTETICIHEKCFELTFLFNDEYMGYIQSCGYTIEFHIIVEKNSFWVVLKDNIIMFDIIHTSTNEMKLSHDGCYFSIKYGKEGDGGIYTGVFGNVIKRLTPQPEYVHQGDILFTLEAMKMSIDVISPYTGKVDYYNKDDIQVETGQLLCRVIQNKQSGVEYDDISETYIEPLLKRFASSSVSSPKGYNIKRLNSFTFDVDTENPTGYDSDTESKTHQQQIAINKKLTLVPDVCEIFKKSGCVNFEKLYEAGAILSYQCITGFGEKIVIILNDFTLRCGSFGHEECLAFVAACEYALERDYNVVYWCCSAGARIQLPDALYETGAVTVDEKTNTVRIHPDYMDKLVTNSEGYGCEILDYCSKMARVVSLLRRRGAFITFVNVIAVGIAAYIAKLGERIIQRSDSALILTGHKTLNNLMGGEVYSSNNELGGSKIMARNGISHIVVESDKQGVAGVLQWLEFHDRAKNTIQHGSILFESFMETFALWAPSVKSGRARVNGRSVAVIQSVAHKTSSVRYCDPSNPNTQTVELEYSPGVWYNESSEKTARTLMEARYENIPTVIMANFRGFSGGSTDMQNAILTSGASIVHELTHDGPPVIIYVSKYLNGGAFAVLSKSINPERIKIIAMSGADFGVLEPHAASKFVWKNKHNREFRIPTQQVGQQVYKMVNTSERLFERGVVDKVIYDKEELQNAISNFL